LLMQLDFWVKDGGQPFQHWGQDIPSKAGIPED
jgi:hypothetical protein